MILFLKGALGGALKQTYERPWTVLALVAAITLAAVAVLGTRGVGLDSNPYFLDPSHPSMVAMERLKADFTGTRETALILLRNPDPGSNPDGIYTTASLQRVARLSTAIEELSLDLSGQAAALAQLRPQLGAQGAALVDEALQGGLTRDDEFPLSGLQELIETETGLPPQLEPLLDEVRLRLYPVREVTSLATVENIVADGDSLRVGRLYDEAPADAAGLAALRAEIEGNALFRGMLIAENGQATGIMVETFIPAERSELITLLHGAILEQVQAIPGAEEVHIAGMPVMAAESMRLMQQDNARLFPMVIGIVVLILVLSFRRPSGVLLPLGVVLISLLWTLGFISALGYKLDMMTTSLPVFLITVGVADGIHMVSEFVDNWRRMEDRKEAVQLMLTHMALPVVMTSVTTAAGFVALSFTDITQIRHFGAFVAVGVIAAMVVSLTFIPATLSLGRKRPAAASTKPPGPLARLMGRWDARALGFLVFLNRMALRRGPWVVALTGVIVAVSIYGATKVRVENDFLTYFDADAPVAVATRALDAELAGSMVANVLISHTGGGEEPFKQPANLAAAAKLQVYLETLPEVGRVLSLVTLVERVNKVLHANDPAYDRLPVEKEWVVDASGVRQQVSGTRLLAQYLFLYESGGGENLSNFNDSNYTTLNMQVLLNTRSTTAISRVQEEIAAYAAAQLPPEMTVRLAGAAELVTATNNEVLSNQMRSLALSLVLIAALLLLQFRSLSKGLLGMLPLGAAILFNFGVMGYFGLYLNIGTAIVSSVVIGVGVDFAIHYLARLQTELARHGSVVAAFDATMASSGKAITTNAVTVALGFLALLLSGMLPLRLAGWMIAQLLIVSAGTTLLLIPAAIAVFRPSFARFDPVELNTSPLHPEPGPQTPPAGRKAHAPPSAALASEEA